MVNPEFTVSECSLAKILLPVDSKIRSDWPELSATLGQAKIFVDCKPKVSWQVHEAGLRNLVRSTPGFTEITTVRHGALTKPYAGFERIYDQHTFSANTWIFRWELSMEHQSKKVLITLYGPGQFAENERLWTQVIESFRFR